MNKKVYNLAFVAFLAMFFIGLIMYINNLHRANKRLSNNQVVLMDSIYKYKVADSLNAAKINVLELSLSEYKKYREDDAKLIKKLEAEKLAAISSIKTVTETKVITITKDSIIYIDRIPVDTVQQIKFESKWMSINGFIDDDTLNIEVSNREELLIVESLIKKRLWFVKLPVKIFGYKTKSIDAVSKNPNTQITNLEYIQVYK